MNAIEYYNEFSSSFRLETLAGPVSVSGNQPFYSHVRVDVTDESLRDERLALPGVEATAIQRLISLAHSTPLNFFWQTSTVQRLLQSPASHPLAAVALCLKNAHHFALGDTKLDIDILKRVQSAVTSNLLNRVPFADSQIFLCIDHAGLGRRADFYELSTHKIRSSDDFECFLDTLLATEENAIQSTARLSGVRAPLARVLYRLLENTEEHAKLGFEGAPVQPNSIRGLMVKRILEPASSHADNGNVLLPTPCLEFTIFDSGMGFVGSYQQQLSRNCSSAVQMALDHNNPLHQFSEKDQKAFFLKCFFRNAESLKLVPDARAGHRGYGLHEVLLDVKKMQGKVEFRTEAIHGVWDYLHREKSDAYTKESSKFEQQLSLATGLTETLRGSQVRIAVRFPGVSLCADTRQKQAPSHVLA